METEKLITLKTSMTCESCVAKVEPALIAQGISKDLKFDMNSPAKTVQFVGSHIERDKALQVLKALGYQARVLTVPTATENKKSFFETFKPLIIIALFLIGTTALVEIKVGAFDAMRAMSVFMGAFFIVFSFFKFLDVSKFADAFATYDLIGKRSRIYSLSYPFVELFLGVSFILQIAPVIINILTAFLMVVGALGVIKVLQEKKTIQCACLGTVFNLPMTKVTFFENTLMFLMSVAMLSFYF